MKSSWWGAGLTYVGAVVGAGFASGQEIYQFFTRFGVMGTLGIILAGCLFAVLGYKALEQGRRWSMGSYGSLLQSAYPPWLVRGAEGLTTVFLVIGLGVVASAGGADVAGFTGLPAIFGAFITIIAVVAVAARGTGGMIRLNMVLVPYLVVMVLVTVALNWNAPGVNTVVAAPAPGWLISALLYLSYNVFTGVMVLLGVGRTLTSPLQSFGAAFLGAAILSLLAYAEHHLLMTLPVIAELPMVDAALHTDPLWGIFFGAGLWVALFTTGVAEAYILSEQYGKKVLWGVCATFLLGLIRFDNLVRLFYPLMGMVAIVLWIPLVYKGSGRRFPGG